MDAVDKSRLIKFLEDNRHQPPYEPPSMLVRYALYQGLADRIRNGEFDIEKGD